MSDSDEYLRGLRAGLAIGVSVGFEAGVRVGQSLGYRRGYTNGYLDSSEGMPPELPLLYSSGPRPRAIKRYEYQPPEIKWPKPEPEPFKYTLPEPKPVRIQLGTPSIFDNLETEPARKTLRDNYSVWQPLKSNPLKVWEDD